MNVIVYKCGWNCLFNIHHTSSRPVSSHFDPDGSRGRKWNVKQNTKAEFMCQAAEHDQLLVGKPIRRCY